MQSIIKNKPYLLYTHTELSINRNLAFWLRARAQARERRPHTARRSRGWRPRAARLGPRFVRDVRTPRARSRYALRRPRRRNGGQRGGPAAVVVAGTQARACAHTARGVHSCDPACYLLEIDRARILLDCGWDDKFTPALLGPLRGAGRGAHRCGALSPQIRRTGALPYALALPSAQCATIPVHKMGQMFMYDHYLSRQAFEDFDVFDLDDVDLAFSAVRTLRYSQQAVLTGRAAGVTIVPHAAGHTLGGTVWRIAKDAEEIIYAVDYNHRREKHLNGTTLDELRRPTLLITGARAASPDGGKMRTGGGGGGRRKRERRHRRAGTAVRAQGRQRARSQRHWAHARAYHDVRVGVARPAAWQLQSATHRCIQHDGVR